MYKVTKNLKKITTALILALVALFAIDSNTEVAYAATTGLNSWEITSKMTIGWNLGNSLDATYWTDNPTPVQSVTAWGNPEPTQQLFDKVKSLGFNTVRIPVTWYQHLTYNNATQTYEINQDWLDYVKKTVDYAYNNDMFVIINVHHENWVNVDYFNDSNLATAKTKLKDIWQQLSVTFANYDQRLIFEGMNEPRQTYNSSVEWGNGDSYSWDYINQLNSTFISTVRNNSSGYNSERLLMIPSYHATDNYEALSHLDIPSNSGNIAISVHAYEPYSFTMDSSESHKYQSNNKYGGYNPDTLKSIMNDLKKIQSEKNAPIIIGEFGASDFNNTDERVAWAKDYMTQATSAGFVCVLWDNNADNDYSSSENFGFINRSTNELYDNAKSVVSTLINYAKKNTSTDTSNTGNTGSTDNTGDNSGSEKDYSWKDLFGANGAACLQAWQSQEIPNTLNYINNDYKIVVLYRGQNAPKLVVENAYSYSWDVTVEPSSIEYGENNVAYYNYSDIAAAFSKYGVSIYDMGKVLAFTSAYTEIYGVYAAPV